MLRRHRLTVYATEDGIQAETFVHFKIVQTLVYSYEKRKNRQR